MTKLLRNGAAVLLLIGGVSLAAAQIENDNGTGGANTQNAIGNDFEKTPGSSPTPGKALPGVTGQTMPAKFSAENDAKDQIPLAVNNFGLTADDKRAILQAVAQVRAPASTTGTASASAAANVIVTPPEPGAELSDFFEMRELPDGLTDRLPALRNYKFVSMPERLLLVNPNNRIVVSEIRK